jgi:hypothetical protein
MARTDPLIVYIHIPKTAGSTVNHILHRWDPAGVSHCEAIINDPARLRAAASKISWISGHVARGPMVKALRAVTDRPLRVFTLLREPTAQIASHYNWLIEIFHRGAAFYDGHPAQIREISETIRASDNSDPAVIMANLNRYKGLFLNQQSHVALTDPTSWFGAGMQAQLDAYEGIATESGLQDLLWRMTGEQTVLADRRENESGYHFDRSLFFGPQMQDFLRGRHAFDFKLYGIVSQLEAQPAGAASPGATSPVADSPMADAAVPVAPHTDDVTDGAEGPDNDAMIARELARALWHVTRDIDTPRDVAERRTEWEHDRPEMIAAAKKIMGRLMRKGVVFTGPPRHDS